jgi:hypothetical protein
MTTASDKRIHLLCIAAHQHEYLRAGARYFHIGISDYLRRILDQHIYGSTITASVTATLQWPG